MALELMRERGQVLSGLYTPHDALYQRFGWERAEFKQALSFDPKAVRLRERGARGTLEAVGPDGLERLVALYKAATEDKNGPFVRNEVWWREGILRHWEGTGLTDSDAVVWKDAQGRDQGYAVYWDQPDGREGGWERKSIWIDQFEALTTDAYLGLWEHMLTHDLAKKIISERHPHDPLRLLCDPPQSVESENSWGAMLRVVDVENAIGQRPYVGERAAAATLRIEDRTLAFNHGTWRIEAAEGQMRAERTDAAPDAELDVCTLAALFTGYLKPAWAATAGFLRLHRAISSGRSRTAGR
jgi:predicted acetyltransferase